MLAISNTILLLVAIGCLGYRVRKTYRSLVEIQKHLDRLETRIDDVRLLVSSLPTEELDKDTPFFIKIKPATRHAPVPEKGVNQMGSAANKSTGTNMNPIDASAKGQIGRTTTHIVRCSSCGNKMVYRKSDHKHLVNCENCGKSITLH